MEIDRIYRQLVLAYEGDPEHDHHAWHGPSLVETLKGITAEQSLKKIPGSHSIIELVQHMAMWRTFVAKRLAGEDTFEVTEATDFPAEQNWDHTLGLLHESQTALLTALKAFPSEKLSHTVASRSYDYYTLLHGIVQHDAYHSGQIALLKKTK
ncbi:MAG: DinB family protein [Bacteroidetes bacterium]|nr:DinB family protein [Bacteroidota bacterium]